MGRLADAILQGAFSTGRAPMIDPIYGGQMGYAPNLKEIVSHQSYVSRPLVCILVEAPTGFQFMPDPQKWVNTLKSMVETHARSIQGFNGGLEVATADNPVSGGGELHQDPTNVTRARTQPSFTFVDKYGRPFWNFFHDWITNLIMDPDSKVPNIATRVGDRPTDLLLDQYSATMLFYEPDPSHSSITKAWLTTNMYPLMTGDMTAQRDLTAPGENSTLTVNFAGVSQSNAGVIDFAQQIHDNISFTNANPYLRPAFVDAIAADVLAGTRGYKEHAEELGQTAVLRG